ncbi:hypothetical protein JHK82_031093 [Glycine max]|nr:hypothetical protein JHK82_031093 [Glycine max]
MVSKVLISQGNSTDILYWKTFRRLEVSLDTIQPYAGPLLGFAGEIHPIILSYVLYNGLSETPTIEAPNLRILSESKTKRNLLLASN